MIAIIKHLHRSRTVKRASSLVDHGPVSPPDDAVKSGVLLQKCNSSRQDLWRTRLVSCTDTDLCFSKIASGDRPAMLLDYIPLHEIVQVVSHSHTEENAAHAEIPFDEDEEDASVLFKVQVIEHGHNAGRPVLLKAETSQELEEWVDTIQRCAHEARERLEAQNDAGPLAKERRRARQFYQAQEVVMVQN